MREGEKGKGLEICEERGEEGGKKQKERVKGRSWRRDWENTNQGKTK